MFWPRTVFSPRFNHCLGNRLSLYKLVKNNQKGQHWKLVTTSCSGTDFHFADFWYISTLMSYFRSPFVTSTLTCWCHSGLQIVFQQILCSWYRTFPQSKADNSYDGCRKFFQNKPTEKGWGVGWKRHICENVSSGSICLSVSLLSSSGFSITPAMDVDVLF